MNRFIGYATVLLSWRKVLFWNSLILTFVAAVVSLALPHRYAATASLLPPAEEDPFGIAAAWGGSVGSGRLSRIVASGLLGGAAPSDLMTGVLQSRTVMQGVVERCSIVDHYRVRKGSMEKALRMLGKMTDVLVSDEGIVAVTVEAKTPELAARVANVYVEELDNFMRTSNISRGRNMRVFIERRLEEVERDLALAQDSLGQFQRKHSTFVMDEEAKLAVESYVALQSELMSRETQLAMMRQIVTEHSPLLAPYEAEVSAFRSRLSRMETGRDRSGFGVGFSVSLDSLPSTAAEYLRRYRDYRVYEESYLLLYQQLEYARVLEARDTPTVTVLDMAVPPERRSFPRRFLIVLGVFAASLAFGVAFAFTAEYFDSIRESRPDEHARWQALWVQFKDAFRGATGFLRRTRRPR